MSFDISKFRYIDAGLQAPGKVFLSSDVGAWVRELQEMYGAPGVKQQFAAVGMLYDWLVSCQVVPMNAPAAMRGPKRVMTIGKTPGFCQGTGPAVIFWPAPSPGRVSGILTGSGRECGA